MARLGHRHDARRDLRVSNGARRGSAGSLMVSCLGKQAMRVVLAATIADRSGAQVPFSYGVSASASAVATK
jgi:hypothetical protein